MIAKVCVSVLSSSSSELLEKVRKAEKSSADLIEVRLDALSEDGELPKVSEVKKPLIATNRTPLDRGTFDESEESRIEKLLEAVEGGFSYVDLELRTPGLRKSIETFRGKGSKIILSHHDFYRTPAINELQLIKAELENFRPDFCKIVTMANSLEDNFTVLGLLGRNSPDGTPLVSFAMGEAGAWSRVIGPFYGSAFTYASLEHGSETAPGQLSISDLRSIYRTLRLE